MIRRAPAPLIAAAASLVLAVIIIVVLILPKASQVTAKQRDLQSAQDQQQSLQLQLRQLQAARAEAPKDRAALAALQALVPPTPDLPGLIRLLDEAAGEAGVTFMSVSPGQPLPVTTSAGVTAIPGQIMVTGSFFALEEYLIKLESLGRAASVQSMNVVPEAATGSGLQMSLTVQFFTSDASAGPGSAPGPTGPGGGPSTAPGAKPSATPSSPFAPSPGASGSSTPSSSPSPG
jgi:Tfp pilus assembly protein PilO